MENIVSDNRYGFRSIKRHGNTGQHLLPSSDSIILKNLQANIHSDKNTPLLSGHSFCLAAALDLLEEGKPLEKIMLKGGWQSDATKMKYIRSWTC